MCEVPTPLPDGGMMRDSPSGCPLDVESGGCRPTRETPAHRGLRSAWGALSPGIQSQSASIGASTQLLIDSAVAIAVCLVSCAALPVPHRGRATEES
jgi:hypothetical protein